MRVVCRSQTFHGILECCRTIGTRIGECMVLDKMAFGGGLFQHVRADSGCGSRCVYTKDLANQTFHLTNAMLRVIQIPTLPNLGWYPSRCRRTIGDQLRLWI